MQLATPQALMQYHRTTANTALVDASLIVCEGQLAQCNLAADRLIANQVLRLEVWPSYAV